MRIWPHSWFVTLTAIATTLGVCIPLAVALPAPDGSDGSQSSAPMASPLSEPEAVSKFSLNQAGTKPRQRTHASTEDTSQLKQSSPDAAIVHPAKQPTHAEDKPAVRRQTTTSPSSAPAGDSPPSAAQKTFEKRGFQVPSTTVPGDMRAASRASKNAWHAKATPGENGSLQNDKRAAKFQTTIHGSVGTKKLLAATTSSARVGPIKATSSRNDQIVKISTPVLDQAALIGLAAQSSPSSVAGMPHEIEVDGAIPAAGIVLTYTFPAALPTTAKPTWAYYDKTSGTWKKVATSLSADRKTMTARVNHLSLWSAFVDGVKAGFQAAVETGKQAYAHVQRTTAQIARAIQDAATHSAESFFWGLSSVLDTRVAAPVCDIPAPNWFPVPVFPENHMNNPILWCYGGVAGDPNQVVVKARVNRSMSFTIHSNAKVADYHLAAESANLRESLTAAAAVAGGGSHAQWVQRMETAGALVPVVPGGSEAIVWFDRQAITEYSTSTKPLIWFEKPTVMSVIVSRLSQALVASGIAPMPAQATAFASVIECWNALEDLGTQDWSVDAIKAFVNCAEINPAAIRQAALGSMKYLAKHAPASLARTQLSRSIGLLTKANIPVAVIAVLGKAWATLVNDISVFTADKAILQFSLGTSGLLIREKRMFDAAKSLRFFIGGGVLDTATGEHMPQQGADAVRWLTKRLGEPTRSNGACSATSSKYYAWNNLRIVVLTKPHDVSPGTFNPGEVGGWQIAMQPHPVRQSIDYKIADESGSKYLVPGARLSQAARLFPDAEPYVHANRMVINYWPGDVTNIWFAGEPGSTSTDTLITDASAGAVSSCGADADYIRW